MQQHNNHQTGGGTVDVEAIIDQAADQIPLLFAMECRNSSVRPTQCKRQALPSDLAGHGSRVGGERSGYDADISLIHESVLKTC